MIGRQKHIDGTHFFHTDERSGAGIVADSVPETEYQETINKARAVVEAVKQSEGGLR